MLQDGWRLLTRADLETYDKTLWISSHGAACPGFAVARMGGGAPAYAIALFRQRGGRLEETVRLRLPGAMNNRVLLPVTPVPYPLVVWRLGPGPTQAWDGGPTIRVAHDSIIIEQMEASSTQVFLSRGRLRIIRTSD